ncbi:complex I 24 kDa subunit family protein [Caproiciproducens faecalis]|uniref:NAD(P)H-dependent oxidoreductase subunit E n=1 Tax=Caproiciproducens faecalis TaxID=2820301 RepID=A0ABS7DLR0_9FIRM|nr:NAD(P)H-dependent oxidoreductase subunit E [Caproiciproducens faecalis]MBW7572248.1 NAD(P)H-dependent oxidoreductase subunit E [Caproiciproducens faecalis]
MDTQCDHKILDEILKRHQYKSGNIIAILQDTQEVYRYLPKAIFPYYSDQLGISQAQIFSIATFYENFSLEPKGKYVIKVCDGTACHVRKSTAILDQLRKELGLSASKKTTDDLLFTVETVSCLGACGLAPTLTVNDKVMGLMTPQKVTDLLVTLKEDQSDAEM